MSVVIGEAPVTDHTDPSSSRAFGCGTALLHVMGILCAYLVVSLFFAIGTRADAEKAGALFVDFAIPCGILGTFWSFARQKGRSALAHSIGVLLLLAFGAEVVVLTMMARAGEGLPRLSVAEKARPVIVSVPGGEVLCQSALGIVVRPATVALVSAPELDDKVQSVTPEQSAVYWAYREPSGAVVVIMGAKGFDSEDSLHRFVKGVSERADNSHVDPTSEAVEWRDGAGSIDLAVTMPNQLRAAMHCVSSKSGLLACVQTVGGDIARLEDLRSSVAISQCP